MPDHELLRNIGWDAHDPQALSHFLDSLPEKPRLLGLGEPRHLIEAFPEWRNRFFRLLVERHGYRSLALESDILASQRVNEFVTGGAGTLDDVMRSGFSHGFGVLQANRQLVGWMRGYNENRPPDEQLRFYGFDAPMENMWAASPRLSLLHVHAFLSDHRPDRLTVDTATIERLSGDDARWTNEQAAMNPSQSVGNTDEARQLRLIADDLHTLLNLETPRLAALPGWWNAQLHARTAVGLLRYHAIMADTDPARYESRMERLLAQRDLMMADHLIAILEQEKLRGPTLVFAHNSHLKRDQCEWSMGSRSAAWWGAGAHLNLRLGPKYAFIATAFGSAPSLGIHQPGPDTLEGALIGIPSDVSLFNAKDLLQNLSDELTTRTDAPVQTGYFPLRRQDLHQTDGVLFIKTAQ
ncbi:erythromycin esterase family protein [Deinococcus fonticola]|uniref:erythromycin esterase family protein n=1 Tax=Deinococcus fonticola TaxID=2528713 RepID=UPI0010753D7B|nr:erythromycin esterase family protein [Deinococcus fonticola]